MEDAPRNTSSRAELYWELSYIVTRLFTEAPDPTPPIPAIAQMLGRRLGWDVVAAWKMDEARMLMTCAEFWHAPDFECDAFEKVSRARHFAFGEGLPGSAWHDCDVVWYPDVTREDNFPRASIAQLENVHAGVAFPLYAGRRVLGVMELFSREVREPETGMLNFLHALGGQIGVFLERALGNGHAEDTESQFQQLAEIATDAVFTIDEESKVLFVNSAVQRIFGYAPAELIGQKLTMVMPEYLRHVHEAGIHSYVETGQRHIDWGGVPLPGLHKLGHEIPLVISFAEFSRAGKRVFTGFVREVSDRSTSKAQTSSKG